MRRAPLYVQILCAMVLGALVGSYVGASAEWLGEIGKIVIQMIKTFALPLLFFAIIDAFLRTEVKLRSAGRMVTISMINAAIALAIGLGVSNWLEPGKYLLGSVSSNTAPAAEKLDFMKSLAGHLPTNIIRPFAEESIITVIIIALLMGPALRRVGSPEIANGVQALYQATSIVLGWIIRLIPIAVFGVVAKVVGTQGFSSLKGLLAYVGVALLGLCVHVLVVYQSWIYFVAKRSLREFWRGARDAIVYALGASSSLATLPVTLKCLDQMRVSPQSARLSACVGTNLNNDGILLYEAMAVLFVAQAHGIDLSLGQQILAALACLVAGVGIAGIPDAGLISLSLVLATVGLPLELLPLLLSVDWILSRARATTNVISDMTVAVVLDSNRRSELD